jgi:hypothetical protein
MRRVLGLIWLALLPSVASAGPPERIVVRIRDHSGAPVRGAHVVTIEGTAEYVRQGVVRSDSTGMAVAEVGDNAFVGLRVLADGYAVWRLDLEPGAPDRKRKVIEVRLLPTRSKGFVIPISH